VIDRAYLPHLTSRQALRLLTKLRRPYTNHGPVQQHSLGDAPDTRRYGGHRPSDPPQKRRLAGKRGLVDRRGCNPFYTCARMGERSALTGVAGLKAVRV
jgi:hypothetical protein